MLSKKIKNKISDFTIHNPGLMKHLYDTKIDYKQVITRKLFRKLPDTSTSLYVDVFFDVKNKSA